MVDADANTTGRSVRTVEKNTEALLVGSKEIAPGVNADKTKYMVLFAIRMQDEVMI